MGPNSDLGYIFRASILFEQLIVQPNRSLDRRLSMELGRERDFEKNILDLRNFHRGVEI